MFKYLYSLFIFILISNNYSKGQKIDSLGNGFDFQDKGVPLDRFNYDWIFASQSGWAASHIINPFCTYMLFQDTPATIILFLIFESFEVGILMIDHGSSYVIFIGDDMTDRGESPADSLIGDIFNGFLGLLLGRIHVFVFQIPCWNP